MSDKTPDPATPEEEDIGTGIDFVDPIKRDPDEPEEEMPGLDPMVGPVPPE